MSEAAAPLRIGVCDYGVGNLHSVQRALREVGVVPVVTSDAATLLSSDGVVLPGVGAFGAAMDALQDAGLIAVVTELVERGIPLLGVCLGFQVFFEESEESGGRAGLGLLEGAVRRIDAARGRVPHMGWNQLHHERPDALLDSLPEGTHVYFVHSYAAEARAEDVLASADYGGRLVAACRRGLVMGTQFHPEKSGRPGLRIYAGFAELCARAGRAA